MVKALNCPNCAAVLTQAISHVNTVGVTSSPLIRNNLNMI